MVQIWNRSGVKLGLRALFTSPSMLIPHYHVETVNQINFQCLKRQGIQGIVFDKDNTFTAPYSDVLHDNARMGMQDCLAAFQQNAVVFSNTAGSSDDPTDTVAQQLERALGFRVVRHSLKKPEGIEDVMRCFPGIDRRRIVCIGDRLLTDVLFGNLHGMVSVLTRPIDGTQKEKAVVRVLRQFEEKWLTVYAKRFSPPQQVFANKIRQCFS